MTPNTKFWGGTYKLYAIVSPWRQIVSHIRKTHDFWRYTKLFLAGPSEGLPVVWLSWWLIAYFLCFLWRKKQYKHGSYNLILQFIIPIHFEINASVPFHVKASALNLVSGCQGVLVSAGQVFSFLVASFLGPPLLSCSGRSWPQQMLNKAGESLRPRCRGGQGHCPKPVGKEEKDAIKWHYIIFKHPW